MNRFFLPHSKKTIPIPGKKQYFTSLTEKTEDFGKRMLWKLFHVKNPGCVDNKEKFGFKTTNRPPMDDDLKPFFDELFGTINKIRFRNPNINAYQKQLKSDVEKIRKSDKVIASADKTDNLYEIPKDIYEKKLTEELSKEYRKASRNELDKVNLEAAAIMKKIELGDRIDIFREANPVITFKDHKENFTARPTFRLINPAKTNIGRISKIILERANKAIRKSTGANQWSNSKEVIQWFKNIPDKRLQKFIKFDVDSFYPSITKRVFKEALEYAKEFVDISETEEEILYNARKSFVTKDSQVWMKIQDSDFDVPMGAYDGAEVAELIGLYLLSKIRKIIPSAGLFRDDGLGVLKLSGPQLAKVEKKLHKLFKDHDLTIKVETNITKTDFLDFELCLETGTVKPWRKVGNNPKYINVLSSHPSSVIKCLPTMISTRLSSLSSSENEFNAVKSPYEEALKSAGYQNKDLKYEEPVQNAKRRTRKRKIIWYNPPFSSQVSSNLTLIFYNLIKKHFKPDTLLGRLFNKNTMKLSYSTTANLAQIINGHNRKILSKDNSNNPTPRKMCNCEKGVGTCPVEGECLTMDSIYEATVTSENIEAKKYVGSAATTFKARHDNHKSDFKISSRRIRTKLAGYVWTLKDQGIQHNTKFNIKETAKSYTPNAARCLLCITEKLRILQADPQVYLNDRTEIFAKCRQRFKIFLSNQLNKKGKLNPKSKQNPKSNSTPVVPPNSTPVVPTISTPVVPPNYTPIVPPNYTPMVPPNYTPVVSTYYTPIVPQPGGNKQPVVPQPGGNKQPVVPQPGGNQQPVVPQPGGNQQAAAISSQSFSNCLPVVTQPGGTRCSARIKAKIKS